MCQALAKRCDGICNSIVIVGVHDNGIEELLAQSSGVARRNLTKPCQVIRPLELPFLGTLHCLALHTNDTFQQSGLSLSAKLGKLLHGDELPRCCTCPFYPLSSNTWPQHNPKPKPQASPAPPLPTRKGRPCLQTCSCWASTSNSLSRLCKKSTNF